MKLKQFDVSADCAACDMKLFARSDETPWRAAASKALRALRGGILCIA